MIYNGYYIFVSEYECRVHDKAFKTIEEAKKFVTKHRIEWINSTLSEVIRHYQETTVQ